MGISEKRIHLIGIGGIGMSGIAKVLLSEGCTVTGSDSENSRKLEELRARGAHITVGHAPENPDLAGAEMVIVSLAIDKENVELAEALRRGKKVLTYAGALGLVMKDRTGVAVAGTHGKSTTTALTAFTLRLAGEKPSFVVGADVDQLGGSSYAGNGRYFVVEACEYGRSFHSLSPKLAIVLNIEEDHLDYYHDVEEIVESFGEFVELLPRDGFLMARADDRNVLRIKGRATCPVETFGLDAPADWQACERNKKGAHQSFSAYYRGKFYGRFELAIPGEHNVLNALSVIGLASHLGLATGSVVEAINTFRGARRRFQMKEMTGGPLLVDDYAHHPTEIRVTLSTAREAFPNRRILCIFQPHQHSRTRFLLKDFARSFSSVDVILVPDIYFVRDSALEKTRVSSKDLVREIKALGGNAIYLPTFVEIVDYLLSDLHPRDVIITMGAGNVHQVGEMIYERLAKSGGRAGAA